MNVAIIGGGGIARKRHVPTVAAYEGVNFYAICDVVAGNADEIAAQYHVKAFYDLNKVLADPEVDAVIICTPERFHKDNVIAALRAGKHVLCEKPLALNGEEAQAIVDAWKETDRMLMVAFSQRTYNVHQTAKKLVADGVIGQPIFFRTNLANRGVEYTTIAEPQPDYFDRNLRNIGGVMLNVGCHRVDLVDYLFDSHIAQVQAFTPTIDKKFANGELINAEDHALINVKLENGLSGLIWTSWSNYGDTENETVIYGSEGVLRTFDGPGITVTKKDGTKSEYAVGMRPEEYVAITTNFLDALTGKGEMIADGMDGLRCMKVLDAVKRSNADGSWVRL